MGGFRGVEEGCTVSFLYGYERIFIMKNQVEDRYHPRNIT